MSDSLYKRNYDIHYIINDVKEPIMFYENCLVKPKPRHNLFVGIFNVLF